MEDTIYKKDANGNYVPISWYDPEICDGFPIGSHVVVKKEGSAMRRYRIDPMYAPMLAVAMESQDELASVLVDVSKARHDRDELTEEQKEAWEQMRKAFDGLPYIAYPSNYDIIEKWMDVLSRKTQEMLTCESARKAYDDFLLVYKLSK